MNNEDQHNDDVRRSQTPGERLPEGVERDWAKVAVLKKVAVEVQRGMSSEQSLEGDEREAVQILGSQSDGRCRALRLGWQLKGQEAGTKRVNRKVHGEFQPWQEVVSLTCAQRKGGKSCLRHSGDVSK